MTTSGSNRPGQTPNAQTGDQSKAGGNKTDTTKPTQQESGASGGAPPTADELAGRGAGSASGSSNAQTGAPKRPGVDPNNASQHEVQGSADADADRETGDQSQGASKRMD